MFKVNRLAGIDLCRGLAAFAVILVHSGDETWGIPISERAIYFRHLFYFAVPFFLAASFCFATKNLPLNISVTFWQKKIKRILIPYLAWSIFYLILKSIVFLVTNNSNQISQLWSDPLAIIFFGGASYHLYFIPLLFIGFIWLYLANYLTKKKKSILIISICLVLSIILYQLLLNSNNSFDLGSYTAFSSILSFIRSDNLLFSISRIILVNLAWAIRCLPYFLIALLINQLSQQNRVQWLERKLTIAITLSIFLFINILGRNFMLSAVNEIAIAYSLLLFAISISYYLEKSPFITNLGICSFGIYLIHPFIKSVVELLLIKLIPQITQSVSIISMLIYSISSFIASWLLIALLLKKKSFSQYI